MKSGLPLGDGTLLPSTANRKQKNAQSSRVSKQPTKADRLNIQSNAKDLIQRALDEANGNRTEAARKLGISRSSLYRHLQNPEKLLVASIRQPRPIPPPPATPAVVAAQQAAAPTTMAEMIFRDRTWPRTFALPCMERFRDYKAEVLVAQLALTFHGIEAEMHELVATLAPTRPTEAAALAEAVAILEQCACMEGLATALDDTPRDGESPALRLAALAKVQALNRRC